MKIFGAHLSFNAIQSIRACTINRLLLRAGTTGFQPVLGEDSNVLMLNLLMLSTKSFEPTVVPSSKGLL
jgi:hypothetical protein